MTGLGSFLRSTSTTASASAVTSTRSDGSQVQEGVVADWGCSFARSTSTQTTGLGMGTGNTVGFVAGTEDIGLAAGVAFLLLDGSCEVAGDGDEAGVVVPAGGFAVICCCELEAAVFCVALFVLDNDKGDAGCAAGERAGTAEGAVLASVGGTYLAPA